MVAEPVKSEHRSESRAVAVQPRAQTWPVEPVHRSMAYRGPRVVRRAKDLRERCPMMAAAMIAAFVVTSLCIHVSAYARVTRENIQLSSVKRELKRSRLDEDALRAQVSRLNLTVEERAKAMGMVPATPESAQVMVLGTNARTTVAQNGE